MDKGGIGSKILTWLTLRRKTKAIDMARRHVTKVVNTVVELNNTVIAASIGRNIEAEKCISRLFSNEEEADALRRRISEELTKGEISAKEREDLMRLTIEIDNIADCAKDAARNILILMRQPVPKEIWRGFQKISESAVTCVLTLRDGINMLEKDLDETMKRILEVERLEHQVDDERHSVQLLFLEFADQLNAPTLLLLDDALHFMEGVTDYCEDTGDIIRMLVIHEASSKMEK
ncbi:MAG: DUF47 family protein [Candidatus Bathyarchaeota archaeon]|nr:DUF47 family protein [Candidatus Bathyarchaeota archaeon]